MNTELVVDLFEMAVDRMVGNIQAGRDLLVAQALREEVEDIQLAASQLFAVSSSHHMLSIGFRWRGGSGLNFACGKRVRRQIEGVHKALDAGDEFIFSGKLVEQIDHGRAELDEREDEIATPGHGHGLLEDSEGLFCLALPLAHQGQQGQNPDQLIAVVLELDQLGTFPQPCFRYHEAAGRPGGYQ